MSMPTQGTPIFAIQDGVMHLSIRRPWDQLTQAARSLMCAKGDSPGRTATAYSLVGLGPVLAWLTWISWSDEKPSDARHVVWFVTVASACVLAGGLAPRRSTHYAALTLIAILATMATLFLWWSAADSSGLFLVGIVLTAPLVSMAAPMLLLLGRFLIPIEASSR